MLFLPQLAFLIFIVLVDSPFLAAAISSDLQNILKNTHGSDAYSYPTDLTRDIIPVSTRYASQSIQINKNRSQSILTSNSISHRKRNSLTNAATTGETSHSIPVGSTQYPTRSLEYQVLNPIRSRERMFLYRSRRLAYKRHSLCSSPSVHLNTDPYANWEGWP